MSFDEQPDDDLHGECAAEIHRLQKLCRETASKLIKHASDLAQGKLLPGIDTEHWYRSTPLAERRQIRDAIEAAADQHRSLAMEIRSLFDNLSHRTEPKHE